MDTIKNYLDNMFAGIPRTEEITQLQHNIYDNMCEKYQELKAQGKSENEAIGIVISEFGNIDELMEEFGMAQSAQTVSEELGKEDLPEVTLEEAERFLRIKKKVGILVGIGVFLCILGIIIFIGTSVLFESIEGGAAFQVQANAAGLIGMLLLIAVAVGLFVYAGMLDTPCEYMKKPFYMDAYVRDEVEERRKIFQHGYTVSLIIAISLCVLSPVPIFISQMVNENSDLLTGVGVCILLLMVATASFMFIFFGNIYEAYQQLLQRGEYTPEKKKRNGIVDAAAAIIWPLATVVYLYLGFFHNLWHPGWVIYPITGIFFGIFSSIVGVVSGVGKC